MRALLRPMLPMIAVLLVPIIPFVLFGTQLEAWWSDWQSQPRSGLVMASVVIGLYAVHRLLALPAGEPGLGRALVAAMLDEMRARVKTPLRAISTVPGVREVVELPYSLVTRLVPERRLGHRSKAQTPGA